MITNKHRWSCGIAVLCYSIACCFGQSVFRDSREPELLPDGNKVLIIQIHGKLTQDVRLKAVRAIKDAQEISSIRAIVLDVDSTAGELTAVEDIMKHLSRLSIPSYFYVDSTATGVSALLSFATKGVYMSSNARIGAAMPVQPVGKDGKMPLIGKANAQISSACALVRANAQTNGYRQEVGEAMLDPKIVIRNRSKVIVAEGDILTLSGSEANQKMPDGKPLHCHAIVQSLDALLKLKKLDKAERVYAIAAGNLPKGAKTLAKTAPKNAGEATEAKKVNAKEGNVYIIKMHDEFGTATLYEFRRSFKMVKRDPKAVAVVVDMDTPGGRVDIMKEMVALTSACKVPVYLYVKQWALSAGAIYSFSTDGVYMNTGSTLGAASVVMIGSNGVQKIPEDYQEKLNSAIRAMIKSLAEQNGYRAKVGEAMIDRRVELKIDGKVISEKGKLLTLTAKEAVEIMPDGKPLHAKKIVKSIDEVLKLKGLDKAKQIRIEQMPLEHLAGFIVMLTPILMLLAIVGMIVEIRTPGFGVPGLASIACFAIVFFGHYVGQFGGMEKLLLITLGFILLLVEIFVIPGFGICGVLGILCMLGGFVWMMVPGAVPELPGLPGFSSEINTAHLTAAMVNLVATAVLSVIAFLLLDKYLPKVPLLGHIIHNGTEDGFNATSEDAQKHLIGLDGVAKSSLRPSGIAEIDGKRVDVVSQGAFIQPGQRVRVKDVKGVRVIVVPLDAPTPEDEGDAKA